MDTAKLRHPWPIGTKVLSLRGEQDHDENDVHRSTGPNAWGTVLDRENFAAQGWSYVVGFMPSGVQIYLAEGDLEAAPEGYVVLPSSGGRTEREVELEIALADALSRLEEFIGWSCECDNTHEANGTTCCLCQYRAVLGGKGIHEEAVA